MSHTTPESSEFEQAFEAAGDAGFVYQLNRGLLGLYGGLLGAFWLYFLIVVLRDGFDLGLTIVGIILGGVTSFVLFNLLYWKRFVRVSGVVSTDDRILWRHGEKLFAVAWQDIDFDDMGLTDASLGDRKYEHFLNLGGAKLYLFRPHIRMRGMETFLGSLLIHLKEKGRIPEDGKNKKRKGKAKAKGKDT
ncbi:MAG: hypothetical protein ACI9WU_000892 [Myxococcota bacterium]